MNYVVYWMANMQLTINTWQKTDISGKQFRAELIIGSLSDCKALIYPESDCCVSVLCIKGLNIYMHLINRHSKPHTLNKFQLSILQRIINTWKNCSPGVWSLFKMFQYQVVCDGSDRIAAVTHVIHQLLLNIIIF